MIANIPYIDGFWASPELRGPPDLHGFSRNFLSAQKPRNRGGILYQIGVQADITYTIQRFANHFSTFKHIFYNFLLGTTFSMW